MPITGDKIDWPEHDSLTLAMEEMLVYMENNDDYQFSLQELM